MSSGCGQRLVCYHMCTLNNTANRFFNMGLIKSWMRWLDSINRLNEDELGQTPGDSEGQEGLEHCSPQGHKESDTIQQLNNPPQIVQRTRDKNIMQPFKSCFTAQLSTIFQAFFHVDRKKIICKTVDGMQHSV